MVNTTTTTTNCTQIFKMVITTTAATEHKNIYNGKHTTTAPVNNYLQCKTQQQQQRLNTKIFTMVNTQQQLL